MVEPVSQYAHVISMNISGEADYYHLYVPTDGSAIRIVWIESDGKYYYCYPDINLYNMSVEEILSSLASLYFIAQL